MRSGEKGRGRGTGKGEGRSVTVRGAQYFEPIRRYYNQIAGKASNQSEATISEQVREGKGQ